MRYLRQLTAAVQLTHARSAHTTDAATIVTMAAGFTALLGLRQFAWALFPGAAIYWLAPAVLDRALPRRGAGKGAIRLLVLRAVVAHAAHTLGIGWLLVWAVSAAGAAPVAGLLAVAAVVYELPKLLLPLIFGRRVDLDARPLNHVLLQRSDVIGDVVMATPCIEWIRASADCRVSVLCREATSDLLRGHPQLDGVIVDPTATGQRQADGWRGSAIGTLAGRLRRRGIDAAISLWDRPSSLYPLAALFAGIPVRGGNFSCSGGWLLNAGVTRSEEGTRHEVEQNLLRVRALGIVGGPYPRLSIALTPDNVQRARLLLEQERIGGDEFLVALSPATSGTNRRLEPAAYADFAHRIHRSHGARVLLLGTPGDRELTGAILARAPAGTVDLSGRTSVGLLAAVIANCRVHVGGDSGPAHVAAALGVPGVVISPARSQKPLRWAPWMAPHRIVRKRPNCRLRCFPSACRENFCISAITVDDVCDAFNRVAAGDGEIAPLDGGRRYWAALSLSVLLHAPDDRRAADVMSALRMLRCAGFIEYILACRPGGALDDQARAEGFETGAADVATLFETIVEFGGGVVYDFVNGEAGSLRKAMWGARKMGCGARRVVASAAPRDAGALTDALLGADPTVR